jgi:transposase
MDPAAIGALMADKGYDSDTFLSPVARNGHQTRHLKDVATENAKSPSTSRVTWTVISLKTPFAGGWTLRRIATRYDKLVRDFLSAVAIAIIVTFWI